MIVLRRWLLLYQPKLSGGTRENLSRSSHSTEMTSSSESLSVVMSPTRFPSSAFAIGET